jgi:AcrR family transcriptional regulator
MLRLSSSSSSEAAVANAGRPRTAPSGGEGERSTEKRSALIAAAIEALREVAFAGPSARQIARRAGCNLALVFDHFGSVSDLLLAGLDDVSMRRPAAYRRMLDQGGTATDLIDSARAIFSDDLDGGQVEMLVEMISGAQACRGLGAQVAARLAPWREFAETAVRKGVVAGSPAAALLPPKRSLTEWWRPSSAWSCSPRSTETPPRPGPYSIEPAWSPGLNLSGASFLPGHVSGGQA